MECSDGNTLTVTRPKGIQKQSIRNQEKVTFWTNSCIIFTK